MIGSEPPTVVDRVPDAAQISHAGPLRLTLAQPMFRWWWIGTWGLALSQSIQNFAFPWLAYYLTGSTLMVGFTAFSLGVPNAVLAPFGGVLADRAGRARVIRTTQTVAFVLAAVLAVLLLVGGVDIWGVMVIAALLGGVAAFDQPARQAIVPTLVPRELLVNAMALNSTAWNSTRIIGPAVAGALLALFLAAGSGPGGLFGLAAAGYLLMAFCMRQIRLPPTARVPNRSVARDLVEGFGYVARNRLVATIFLVLFASSLFGMSFMVLMPVFAKDVFLIDEAGLGLLVACFGVGGLLGTIGLAVLGSARRRGLVMIFGSLIYGCLLVLFGVSDSLLISVPTLFCIGFTQAAFLIAAHTLLQVIVPDEIRGRVMANYTLIWSFGTVGGTIMGTIAELSSVHVAVAVGGAIIILATLGSVVVTPGIRTLD